MKESMVTTYASSCPLQYLVASQLCENHRTDPDQEFLLPEATIFNTTKNLKLQPDRKVGI